MDKEAAKKTVSGCFPYLLDIGEPCHAIAYILKNDVIEIEKMRLSLAASERKYKFYADQIDAATTQREIDAILATVKRG